MNVHGGILDNNYNRLVQNNDLYSQAVLKECSKKSVTVELKLKYVSIRNIAGVKFELFCNNEIIVSDLL